MSEPITIPCNDVTCEERHECVEYGEPTDPRWRGFPSSLTTSRSLTLAHGLRPGSRHDLAG